MAQHYPEKKHRVFFLQQTKSGLYCDKMPLVVLIYGNLHMLVGLRLAFIQTVCHPI